MEPQLCQFCIKKNGRRHRERVFTEVVETVKRDMYMDDCHSSQYSRGEATDILDGVTSLIAKGILHMAERCSNDMEVIKSISLSERVKQVRSLDLDRDSLSMESAPGMHWNAETDTFGIKIRQKEPMFTRRGLLRIHYDSSVYISSRLR